MDDKTGDLKVWWIPQVPMEPFEVKVSSLYEAKKILDILANYDLFQFNKNVKPDYCNAGGLFIFDKEDGWIDWETDLGDRIDDLSFDEVKQLDEIKQLGDRNRYVVSGINYLDIPTNTILAINNHVLYGQECGSFVEAVLENNLGEAFSRADDYNQRAMFLIVSYLYNKCPMGCWGSVNNVKDWRKDGGFKGLKINEDSLKIIFP
jgi:hypothetical protein